MNRCNFSVPLGDVDVDPVSAAPIINLKSLTITASVAVTIESFSFVFVSHVSAGPGGHAISGVSHSTIIITSVIHICILHP